MNDELVVLTRKQLKGLVAEAVAEGIERVYDLLLKGAGEYLSEKEAAIRLGVDVKVLRAMRKTGTGPAYTERDGLLRYAKADLAQYMAEGRVSPDF